MKNLEIINQLLNGNHLNESELKEAQSILNTLNSELKSRLPHKIDFTRVNSDVNGNPRYVCHFLEILSKEEKSRGLSVPEEYKLAIKKAKKIGGRKFHNKQYGGGIVFQSYNIEETEKAINDNKINHTNHLNIKIMNWDNINLNDNYERDQNIIDPLSFETLLLEISCNIRDITKEEIKKQFETDLQNRIESAREVFNSNLDNIYKKATEERNID